MRTIKQKGQLGDLIAPGKHKNYNEIVEFLDNNWRKSTNNHCITRLDLALGKPSQKIDAILVAGTNGKSLSMYFATKLLQEEGMSVGSFSSPHILTYNERLSLNGETISNKSFTEISNEVLDAAEAEGLAPNSFELLTMMSLLFFVKNNVDVALIEIDKIYQSVLKIFEPKIAAITRITPDKAEKIIEETNATLDIIQPGTWVISADQSKINLQNMLDITNQKGGNWAMPIRKLAPLNYPFEQLHGRCAALAERIAYLYINKIAHKDAIIVSESLLTKPKAQRGRPTLEAKRQAEINPKKTLDQFWKEDHGTLPARFQLLDKEKPTVMLDTASNIDAIKNLLLGIRLLHYQRPIEGLTIILGLNKKDIEIENLLKQLRYFFKKTSGQIFICPVENQPGQTEQHLWDAEKIANDLKSMKVKAYAYNHFQEAFEQASKSVDERNGLVIITGSTAIISQFWLEYKGMKKL